MITQSYFKKFEIYFTDFHLATDTKNMRTVAIFLLLSIFLPFQACNRQTLFSSPLAVELKSESNGEGYGGKPTPFDFLSQNTPCLEVGANGQPLPNSTLFSFPNGIVQLVREQCVDRMPRILTSSEYSINSSGDILYQNHTFRKNLTQSPFDVVAADCPAGSTQLKNPVRTSLVAEPLDLQSTAWEHPGLAVILQGTLGSLPVYKIQRNDPAALESWHRMAQSPFLKAGESYVYSFYVKPDSTEKVMFTSYYPNLQDFRIEFDLATGAATVDSLTGVTLIATKAKAFAGGLYISTYFISQSDVSANIGLASAGQFLGSAISATAFQLEKISNFCGP